MKCSPFLSTSDLPFPCKHVLHDTCQALLIQFPCPYPKERRALVLINTLTVMINKDRWACEAWLVFVITASVGIQLLLMKGWQGSPLLTEDHLCRLPGMACSWQRSPLSSPDCSSLYQGSFPSIWNSKCHDTSPNGIFKEEVHFVHHNSTSSSYSQACTWTAWFPGILWLRFGWRQEVSTGEHHCLLTLCSKLLLKRQAARMQAEHLLHFSTF